MLSPNRLIPADVPASVLLEKFGEKFLDFCQDSGYDRILQVLGATPRDFLQVPRNPIRSPARLNMLYYF